MRSVSILIGGLLLFRLAEADPSASIAELEKLVQANDRQAGFHSLEMPQQRKLSEEVPITVDAECLRFALKENNEAMCRRHDEISKVVVVPHKPGWYQKNHPGDVHVTVFYKGIGKLAILSLTAENVDPFLDALRDVAPNIKKIKDKR